MNITYSRPTAWVFVSSYFAVHRIRFFDLSVRGPPFKVVKVGGKTNKVGALVDGLTAGTSRIALGGAWVELSLLLGLDSSHRYLGLGSSAGSHTSNSVKFFDLDYLHEGAWSTGPLREAKPASWQDAGEAKESSDLTWHLRGNIWANPVGTDPLGSFRRNVDGINNVKEELIHAA